MSDHGPPDKMIGENSGTAAVIDPAADSPSSQESLQEIIDLSMRLLRPAEFDVDTLQPANSKYSPIIHAKLCRLTMLGLNKAGTAKAAGISPSTLAKWCKQFPKLAVDLEQAAQLKSAHVMVLLQQIMVGDGQDAFKAIKFYLETHATEFQKKAVVEVQQTDRREVVRQIGEQLYGMVDDADEEEGPAREVAALPAKELNFDDV